MKIEDLDKVLSFSHITLIPTNPVPGETFNRLRKFKARNELYEIIWWNNGCCLKHKELIIPFAYVRKANTWPNGAKENLQFYNFHNEICCILPTQSWQE